MGIHLLEDGRLCYPNRGFPPLPPEGYEVDPADPFIMIPIYDKCDHRSLVKFTLPCGRIAGRHWCKLHNKEATPETCEFCPDMCFTPIKVSDEVPSSIATVINTTNHEIMVEQTLDIGQSE